VNHPSAESNNTPGPVNQQQSPYTAPFKPPKHCQKVPTSISAAESDQLATAIAHTKADVSNCMQMAYASSAPSSKVTQLTYIALCYRYIVRY
jgi:hypothetical protein